MMVFEANNNGCKPETGTGEDIGLAVHLLYIYKENSTQYQHSLCTSGCLQIWPYSFRAADLVKMPPRHKDAS